MEGSAIRWGQVLWILILLLLTTGFACSIHATWGPPFSQPCKYWYHELPVTMGCQTRGQRPYSLAGSSNFYNYNNFYVSKIFVNQWASTCWCWWRILITRPPGKSKGKKIHFCEWNHFNQAIKLALKCHLPWCLILSSSTVQLRTET